LCERRLKRCDYRLPGYAHAFGNLFVVDSETPQPQNFSVVGHLVISLKLFALLL
jgi:hypothetical protein